MAHLEHQHALLLIASKALLARIQGQNIQVGAVFEYALARAIEVSEVPR